MPGIRMHSRVPKQQPPTTNPHPIPPEDPTPANALDLKSQMHNNSNKAEQKMGAAKRGKAKAIHSASAHATPQPAYYAPLGRLLANATKENFLSYCLGSRSWPK